MSHIHVPNRHQPGRLSVLCQWQIGIQINSYQPEQIYVSISCLLRTLSLLMMHQMPVENFQAVPVLEARASIESLKQSSRKEIPFDTFLVGLSFPAVLPTHLLMILFYSLLLSFIAHLITSYSFTTIIHKPLSVHFPSLSRLRKFPSRHIPMQNQNHSHCSFGA